jgi:FMN phosphatase YigB (HAD superfamily)
MNPIIFCDYGNTLSTYDEYIEDDVQLRKDTIILLNTLQDMKNEGATIYLATDGDDYDAERYIRNLGRKNYDLFSQQITCDTFDKTKDQFSYWPAVMKEFSLQSHEIILLDDNHTILNNAFRNNITVIPSLPRIEAAYHLHAIYTLMCNQ